MSNIITEDVFEFLVFCLFVLIGITMSKFPLMDNWFKVISILSFSILGHYISKMIKEEEKQDD